MNKKAMGIYALWAGLLCAAWMQPSHFPPWGAFHSELIVFIAFAALFAMELTQWSTDRTRWVLAGPEAAITLVMAFVVFQLVVHITDYVGDVTVWGLYLVAMIVAVSTGRQLGERPAAIQSLAWALVLAGFASIVLALLQTTLPDDQFTFVNPMPSWRRPGANLAQPNHLGTLLLWSMVSGIYLQLSNKISRVFGGLLVVLFLAGMAITESRTALLGALASAVWLLRAPIPKKLLSRGLLSLVLAAMGLLLFVLWPVFSVGFQEGGWSNGYVDRGSVNTQVGTRMLVWPQLIAAILERPMTGWGIRGVPAALNAVLDRYTNSDPFSYAHNLILELAIGFGVPLTLLLMVLAIPWCVARVKHLRNVTDWYAVAMLIPFVLHAMLEFPFAYAYFLLPACFAVGMLDAGRWNTLVWHIPQKAAWGVSIAWILLGSVVVRDYFFAEEDFRVARFEALRMGKTPEEYVQPKLWLLDQLDAVNEAIRVVPAPGMAQESLDLLRNATQRYPWPAIQNRYALALALNGNQQEAKRQLKVMRVMHDNKTYAAIEARWDEWAENKYPQLREVLSDK